MEGDFFLTEIHIDKPISKEVKNYLNQLKSKIEERYDYYGLKDIRDDDVICYKTYEFPVKEIKEILSELLKIDEEVKFEVRSWNNAMWLCSGGYGSKWGFGWGDMEFDNERKFFNNFNISLTRLLKEIREDPENYLALDD